LLQSSLLTKGVKCPLRVDSRSLDYDSKLTE
jgi:hypothetical protein